jgi:hypothetical protein
MFGIENLYRVLDENPQRRRPTLGNEGNNAPVRDTQPLPLRPNNNADNRPYKALPIDTTGNPVGVGGAGQQKSPFMPVDKTKSPEDINNKKPPPVEGADTKFEISYQQLGMGVGLIVLLVLVLFKI